MRLATALMLCACGSGGVTLSSTLDLQQGVVLDTMEITTDRQRADFYLYVAQTTFLLGERNEVFCDRLSTDGGYPSVSDISADPSGCVWSDRAATAAVHGEEYPHLGYLARTAAGTIYRVRVASYTNDPTRSARIVLDIAK